MPWTMGAGKDTRSGVWKLNQAAPTSSMMGKEESAMKSCHAGVCDAFVGEPPPRTSRSDAGEEKQASGSS